MISEVRTGSLLIYIPKKHLPGSSISEKSRSAMNRLKQASPPVLARLVEVLAQQRGHPVFDEYFGSDVVLVPIPGHAPRTPGNTLASWPSRDIARAIVDGGLASAVVAGLSRATKVNKLALGLW